ncbi:sporulation membrane protein YtaF [Aceticella autotrophica]|uniref:Sporulation membrane protein YtaF n=1 Tax=Aceticella autotrophica TaxID=2755338 RepID=A0A974Y2J3_9THEO|nr:sporulation membrane protein YtaF [Aceticella autotrophica]QSZ26418.1 sporulation membrane protein YtaF [Aceticella autotrophica]
MYFFLPILYSISANIDNFVVGIAYGIKKIKIGFYSNLLIAVVSTTGTYLSLLIGKIIGKLIFLNITNLIGSIMLILIGLWFILDFFLKKNQKIPSEKCDNDIKNYKELLDKPEKADLDNSGYITIKESIPLAFALTINNIGLGVAAGLAGLNILITTCLTFFFSILSIILGYLIGNCCLSKIFGYYAPLASGIIIVILGLIESFT